MIIPCMNIDVLSALGDDMEEGEKFLRFTVSDVPPPSGEDLDGNVEVSCTTVDDETKDEL